VCVCVSVCVCVCAGATVTLTPEMSRNTDVRLRMEEQKVQLDSPITFVHQTPNTVKSEFEKEMSGPTSTACPFKRCALQNRTYHILFSTLILLNSS
jgi:hypothetical protein